MIAPSAVGCKPMLAAENECAVQRDLVGVLRFGRCVAELETTLHSVERVELTTWCTCNEVALQWGGHVNGLHVDGPVNDIVVIAFNLDGSPKTVLFSGTCGDGCSFSVTVEDHGEPGTSDQFGVTVTGTISEVRSQRVISGGNIQFHK